MRCLLLAVSCCLLTSNCALERDVPPATAGPLDSLVRANVGFSTGKIKFNAPVTFQIGGSNNTATAIDKAKAPIAAAPHATATETNFRANTPWYVFVALVLIGVTAGAWLRGKFSLLSLFK